ncbi:MAG TPA: lysophospholipid acyltransferase family protein [Candidatus Limnocylindria bacterium]|nr:lysophospholipid acyltransferase family protein [Candidatus Limnocylindria bacterium]
MIAGAIARLAEGTLPRVPAALDYPLAAVAGTVAYLLSPGAREAVRENLAIVAPGRTDRERLVRATFVEQVRHYIEIFRLARLDREAVRRTVVASGWEHVVAAYERGNGVVFASAHLGPISVCGQIFVAHGYEVTLPVERDTGELSRAINRARRAMGLTLVQTDSAHGIYRVLKRGGALGLLADRAVTGVGERVTFFGRPALLPSAHVVLALRTGAPLIPGFAHRDGRTLRAVFEPELELPHTGDHDADVREGVRRWAEVLERHIRLAPAHWSVFEAVWRR